MEKQKAWSCFGWSIRTSCGSLTVEAALVLPVFLAVMISLISLMLIPVRHRQMGAALSDTARLLSSAGYVAHLTGATAFRSTVEKVENGGFVVGAKKLETVTRSLNQLGMLPEQAENNLDEAAKALPFPGFDAWLAASRSLTSEAGRLAVSATDALVQDAARELTTSRLRQQIGFDETEKDPWRQLGVLDGEKGVDWSRSHIVASEEAIELIMVYHIKPIAPFGLVPAIRCANRVRVNAWGAGKGPGLRNEPPPGTGSDTGETGQDSLWNTDSGASSVWARGRKIEEEKLARISKNLAGSGLTLSIAGTMQRGYDAVSSRAGMGPAGVWQVVSINPHLPSYSDRQGAFLRVLQDHGRALPSLGEKVQALEGGPLLSVATRHLVVVVPENAPEWSLNAMENFRVQAERENIILEVIRGYGRYELVPAETE